MGFIRDFVDLLLAAQKRLDFLNTLGIGGCDHFGHFYNPVLLQLAVYIFIVQLPQIVGKPLILACQQAKEGGLSRALTAHQTEHDFKFAAGTKCPMDRAKQEQPQRLKGVLICFRSQKMMQTKADALRAIPCEAVQIILDRVIAVLMGGKVGSIYDFLLTCQVVILFQIQPDVLHVRVGHGGAGASVIADGLDNVGAVGQQIVGNRTGEQRIVLKHRQAILDTVADTAFFRGVQHGFYFFNAHRRCYTARLHFELLLHLRRQALPFAAQFSSLPLHIRS